MSKLFLSTCVTVAVLSIGLAIHRFVPSISFEFFLCGLVGAGVADRARRWELERELKRRLARGKS